MYVINHYDINGKHTALDSNNKPLTFTNISNAIKFLNDIGYDIDAVTIEPVTDELNSEYIRSELI